MNFEGCYKMADKENARLRSEARKRETELTRLRADSARLDWVFNEGHVFNLTSQIRKVSNGWRYSMAIKDTDGEIEDIRHWGGETFRQAIDQAMQETDAPS